jgi:hypothetical protein
MRLTTNLIVTASLAAMSYPASAECWIENGENRSAVELTACFMAEVQHCEELVPGFKGKASPGIAKLKSKLEYKEIEKSKDFSRVNKESYKYLASHPIEKPTCNAILQKIESGRL